MATFLFQGHVNHDDFQLTYSPPLQLKRTSILFALQKKWKWQSMAIPALLPCGPVTCCCLWLDKREGGTATIIILDQLVYTVMPAQMLGM